MDELSGTPDTPQYQQGDVVEMKVEISHRARMSIKSIEVRFRVEAGEETNRPDLVLTGVPYPSSEQPQSGEAQWSIANTIGEVSLDHVPGVYNFLSIIVNASGNLRILLRDDEMTLGLFDTALEVVRGTSKPEITSGRFVR